MGVFENTVPNVETYRSGSGHALLHSRGGTLYDITITCGSARGLVAMFQSTSASAATMKFFTRTQANTQGNPHLHFRFAPPIVFTKKIRLKRKGGGAGLGTFLATLGSRLVVKVRFTKSTYRASSS